MVALMPRDQLQVVCEGEPGNGAATGHRCVDGSRLGSPCKPHSPRRQVSLVSGMATMICRGQQRPG